jgi:hypothetical protein
MTEYVIPRFLRIGNTNHNIRANGDYRLVLDCFSLLTDREMERQERILSCLILFYEECHTLKDLEILGNVEQAAEKMIWFFNCGQTFSKAGHSLKLVDWKKDSHIISAAINKVAGFETRGEAYIHWWTYMGYYMSIGESTFSYIVCIRNKILKGKKLTKDERQFQLENPHYFNWDHKTEEDYEQEEFIKSVWNKG